MRRKSLSSVFLIVAFLFTIVSPVAIPQPANAAVIDTISAEMATIYTYLDSTDKTNIDTARGNIASLTDTQWDAILTPLLTDEVKAKYGGDADAARTSMKKFATGIAEFYYSSDSTDLTTRLNAFRAAWEADFHLLFEKDMTMDILFDLLRDSRTELPGAMAPYAATLSLGTNTELLDKIPDVMKDAMTAALAGTEFKNRMDLLHWDANTLVKSQQIMAKIIDTDLAGELGLVRATVRAYTKLYDSTGTQVPTPLGVATITMIAGTAAQYHVKIFNRETLLLAWNSGTPAIGEMAVSSGVLTLTAKSAGNTLITGYRAGGSDPASDWLLKINLTVTSGGGGGGGGGGTVIPPKKEEPTVVKEPEVKEPAKIVPFTDIQGHWAEQQINRLHEQGIVTGYPDNTFQPGNKITRAEFVAMMIKAFNLTGTDDKVFSDTANHWAKDIVSIAVHNGIAVGYDEQTFGPDDPVTREQMAAIIAMTKHLISGAAGKTFTDADLISAWAAASVNAVTGLGLMTGYPDNSFQPQGWATRAEAAVVIYNAINK
ncbi:MAG: S-layer homology domain-containing protein [Syntrophomonas sp.]